MSFTLNYRKLRVSPNATIKPAARAIFRPDGVPRRKQQQQQQGPRDRPRTVSLRNVRMLNTSEYGSGLEPAVKKPKKS